MSGRCDICGPVPQDCPITVCSPCALAPDSSTMSTMGSVMLQVIWVAAYHGLRRPGSRPDLWSMVYDISDVLGYPPAPGPR